MMKLKKNDTFNGGRIRVDKVTPTHIICTYVPLGQQHTISKPTVQEFIEKKLWMDNVTWNKCNFTIY